MSDSARLLQRIKARRAGRAVRVEQPLSPLTQDPFPTLSATCFRCGGEVWCYDEQGLAWCEVCAALRR